MTKRIISKEGLEQLKKELNELQNVKRPEIVKIIEAAVALGDLSENAEYHDAKEQLRMLDDRRAELRDLILNVEVVERVANKNVSLGSNVDVEINGVTKSYRIVGASEAEPSVGKISNESPIGRALFGHVVGDEVTVETPAGKTIFLIKNVS